VRHLSLAFDLSRWGSNLAPGRFDPAEPSRLRYDSPGRGFPAALSGLRFDLSIRLFEREGLFGEDIAGKGIANPLALLLAVGLMLEHIDQPDLANRLRTAIDQVLRKDGVRTPDLGGKASTGDFTQSIIRRLGG